MFVRGGPDVQVQYWIVHEPQQCITDGQPAIAVPCRIDPRLPWPVVLVGAVAGNSSTMCLSIVPLATCLLVPSRERRGV